MIISRKINPVWPLRLGLGLMYAYSGYSLIAYPTAWYWSLRALPQSVQAFINNQVGTGIYLTGQGIGEIIIAFLFLAWFLPNGFVKLATGLAILEFVLIIIFVGIDPITFRDIGLLGAALSLWILLVRK